MWAFHRYFLHYLVFGRTRQGILFLALAGLFLSSFALTVVQGVMGGLQRSLVARSKLFHGAGTMVFAPGFRENEAEWFQEARRMGLSPVREIETELLVRHGSQVAPLVLHGVDLKNPPPFLKGRDLSGVVLGADLAHRLKVPFYGELRLVSPAATDALMGEVPRQVATTVGDYLVSEVAELDMAHGWVRLSLVQNILRQREVERWRFFREADFHRAREKWGGQEGVRAVSWEEAHGTLVWALNLETRVMLALFIGMSLLVALAITTGLLLFFARIRPDLASFWIMGMSLPRLKRLCLAFVVQLSGAICLLGVSVGSLVLWALERYGHDLMPDVFVERHFPVQFSWQAQVLAFVAPFLIATVFSLLSFAQFRRENRTFIHLVRGAGQAG